MRYLHYGFATLSRVPPSHFYRGQIMSKLRLHLNQRFTRKDQRLRLDHDHRIGHRTWRCNPSIRLNLWVLLTCLLAYAINQAWFKTTDLTFFHWYYNDLLAMPLFLAYANLLIAITGKTDQRITTFKGVMVLTLFCATLWEGLGPQFIPYATADPIDVLCYVTGATVYYWIVNHH